MAKAQGKKAAAKSKTAAKIVKPTAKKTSPATKATPAKSLKTKASTPAKAEKKPASKVAAKANVAKAPAKVPVNKAVAKAKPVAKPAPKAAAKPVAKTTAKPPAKATAKSPAKAAAKPSAKAPVAAVTKPVPKAAAPAPKDAAKPAPKVSPKVAPKAKAAPAPVAAPAPKAPVAPPRPVVKEAEKKRGRRARPRVQSSGAPAAAWLSTEKPRPASFIPAPPRAEAPSAIAAPPASSDRLIRPEDVAQPVVRTVPVRIDVEQGAGRFYVIANPSEVSVRVGEGIEWDFRYLGGADVTVEEINVEFDRPSPFTHQVFRTRKPGGARPHRALSEGAIASAAGRRIQYTVRAMTGFKTEVASTKLWMSVTA
jgi:hypothetical protein